MKPIASPAFPAARLPGGSLPQVAIDLFSYGVVSALALLCDYGLLLILAAHGVHYLFAQAASFSAGMVVAYVLSAHFVFAARRGTSRTREAIGFAVTGVAGLVLSQCLLLLFVSGFQLELALAKIPTAGCVFLFNFVVRRGLVFAGSRTGTR